MADKRKTSFSNWLVNANLSFNTLVGILTFVASSMIFGIFVMIYMFSKFVPVATVPQLQMFYDNQWNTFTGLIFLWIVMLLQCLYTIWNSFVKIETPKMVSPKTPQTKKPLFVRPTLPIEKPKKTGMVSMVGKKQNKSPPIEQPQTPPPKVPKKNKGGRPKGSKNKPKEKTE